jgi:hypothetical protein
LALLSVAASVGVATIFTNAAPASALSGPVTLGFTCDAASTGGTQGTPEIGSACLNGSNQFSTVVSALGTNQARFSFFNVGSAASSITNIDILDAYPGGVFSGLSAVQPSNPGVTFSSSSFPGGSYTSIALPILPIASQIVNGINPGDSFSLDFDIAPGFGKPFNAVATQLFRKGISIQLQAAGFDPVTVPAKIVFNSQVKPVPEPITMLGSAAALGFGALMKRRSSKLKAKKGSSSTPSTCETLA